MPGILRDINKSKGNDCSLLLFLSPPLGIVLNYLISHTPAPLETNLRSDNREKLQQSALHGGRRSGTLNRWRVSRSGCESRSPAPRWKKWACGPAGPGGGTGPSSFCTCTESPCLSMSTEELSVLSLDQATQTWNLTCFKRLTSLGPSVSASCPAVRGMLQSGCPWLTMVF